MQKNARVAAVAVSTLTTLAALVIPAAPASATGPASIPTTGRVSVSTAGAQAVGGSSGSDVDISSDGRWLAFTSFATNLVAGFAPTPASSNVYLADRETGAVTLVSAPSSGTQANGSSSEPSVSDDGRYVVFTSAATNLTSGDTNAFADIYRRDTWANTTTLISKRTGGTSGTGASQHPDISGNGARIVFDSVATNLLAVPDVLNSSDIFLWSSGTLTRASVTPGGTEPNSTSLWPAISNDGTTIAYQSWASNILTGDTNASPDVYARAVGGATTKISIPKTGTVANQGCYTPSISADGSKVAFDSKASNLVTADTNGVNDAFVRNRSTSTTARASTNALGAQLTDGAQLLGLSADGAHVLFRTQDANVGLLPTDGGWHAYLRDTGSGVVSLVDVGDASGTYGNEDVAYGAVSGTGRYATFASGSSDLVRNDTNTIYDLFVRDRQLTTTPFTSSSALVTQQYQDFLGRPPTASELSGTLARLNNGETNFGRVIVDLAHTAQWSGKRAPLIRLYWAFFLRAPDLPGLNYWVGRLNAGKSLASVAKQFASSSEFQTKYGSKTNEQFVTLIYQNIFNRQPDPSGLAYWTGKLDAKTKTRGDVMVNFSESSEGKRVLAPYADILLVHLGMIGTLPSKANFTAWTNAIITAHASVQGRAELLRTGSTYAARFP